MKTTLFVAAIAVALLGCSGTTPCVGLCLNPPVDSGPQGAAYDELDKATATLVLTVSADGSSAQVTVKLQNPTAGAVTLQQGQAIEVNGAALPVTSTAGTYGQTLPGATTYAVTVKEPRHGVLTTNYTVPAAFNITSSGLHLTGTTITWSPVEPGASSELSLQQQTADGPQAAAFTLNPDPGTKSLTDSDLRDFVQGYPLQITVSRSSAGTALQGVAASTVTLTRAAVQTVDPSSP